MGGGLLLQVKASCLPVSCLSPPLGASLLDACAAPGMKTSQAAGAVGKCRKVVAVERSSKRVATLKEILAKSDADAVTTVLESDFLDVRPEDHPAVQYLVVDPSCSGTGMVLRPGDASEPPQERLDKLAALQTKLLLHALSFPNAKKVVYSTCATSVTENEAVVSKVLATRPDWKSVSAMESWHRKGIEFQGEDGMNFLRAEPNLDLCNGFFVALLKKKKKRKSAEHETGCKDVLVGENGLSAPKKKKGEKRELSQGDVKEKGDEVILKDKKKKKSYHKEAKETPEISEIDIKGNELRGLEAAVEDSTNDGAMTRKGKKKLLKPNKEAIGDFPREIVEKNPKEARDEDALTNASVVDIAEVSGKPRKKKKKKE